MEFLGYHIEVTDSLECWRGGDHRQLIMEARVDYLRNGNVPDDKFVVCGRCTKAISLKI